MKRFKKPVSSVRFRVFLSTSVLVFSVIVCVVFVMREIMIDNIEVNQQQTQLTQAQYTIGKLDNYLMTLMVKTDSLFVSEDFSDLIIAIPKDSAEKMNNYTRIRNYMDSSLYMLSYPEVSVTNFASGTVYPCLYTKNTQSYLDDQFIKNAAEIQNEPYVQELQTQKRMFSWNTGTGVTIGKYIAFNRKLLEYEKSEEIAILQVRVPVSKVQQVINYELPDSVLAWYYLDSSGNTAVSETSRTISEVLLETLSKEESTITETDEFGYCILNSVYSSLNGYRLITVFSAEDVTEKIDFITPVFLGGGIISAVLCSIFLYFLSGRLVRGIRQLVAKTNKARISPYEYDRLDRIRDSSEIEQLDEAYAKLLKRINELNEQENASREELNEVKMELTQEQFNPHLLYNTLSLLHHINESGNCEETADVLTHLIHFYRNVLNRGEIIICVRDEISMIRDYLKIVQKVYQMDLSVTIHVEEDILECCAVKLFLQPVVENAVQHGLKEVGGGNLLIEGKRKEKLLEFTVEDDGTGIEEEKLSQIQRDIKEKSYKTGLSYGLVSISKRLQLLFGDSCSMRVESRPGEGTRVRICLPAMAKKQISEQLKSKII